MKYGKLTWPEVRAMENKDETVIILPVGAIEQHGHHMSLQTDTVLATAVAERTAEKLASRVPVYVTPTFWAGCSNHHMDFPGTLSLSQTTFIAAISELAMNFVEHGFKKLFFLNGHGHNFAPLQSAARNVRDATDGSVIAATANYWHFIPEQIKRIRESPIGGMAHAGEFETSAMLAVAPDEVDMAKAGTHMPKWKTPYFTMDFLATRRVYIAHHVSDFSETGIFGDAAIGTADKGEQLLDAAATKIAEFLEDFSTWSLHSLYEIEEPAATN